MLHIFNEQYTTLNVALDQFLDLLIHNQCTTQTAKVMTLKFCMITIYPGHGDSTLLDFKHAIS